MADDPQAVRQTAQPSVHDLHSQPTTAASGGRELQLPREVPPAAANSPRNVPSQPLQPHTLPSSSALPQPSFLQAPQVNISVTTSNYTLDTMDGSATPVQDKSAESSVPGNGTPAASSSSIAVNTGTTQVRAGGAPARVFMNEKIVPYLLEGMKNVTRDQPPNPLRVLGEFLIQKSNEIEGTGTTTNKSPE